MCYYITDGKQYIYWNVQKDRYVPTSSFQLANDFDSIEKAKNVLNNRLCKKLKKNYYIQDTDTEEIVYQPTVTLQVQKHKDDMKRVERLQKAVYEEKKDKELNDIIIDKVSQTTYDIKNAFTLSSKELYQYKEEMENALTYCNYELEDFKHIVPTDNAPAHKRAIAYRWYTEIRDKRARIKETMRQLNVLIEANDKNWTIQKLQQELKNNETKPYVARTDMSEKLKELFGLN